MTLLPEIVKTPSDARGGTEGADVVLDIPHSILRSISIKRDVEEMGH